MRSRQVFGWRRARLSRLWDTCLYERLEHGVECREVRPAHRSAFIARKYYKSRSGRPSITPGTYFRMLLLGYLEGIDSERGTAWRAADSLSFRKFLEGYDFSEPTPDHSAPCRGPGGCTRLRHIVR